MKSAEVLAPEPVSPVEPKPVSSSGSRPPGWLVIAAFAAVYLIWGSTYLGIRIAIETMPPFLMAGVRFTLAGTLLYTVMRWSGVPRPEPIHWRDASIIGGLLLFAGNGGVTWAEKTVPSGIAALIVAGTSLWIIVVDWLRPGGRRPHALVFGGLVLGFAGVTMIVSGRSHTGQALVDPLGAGVLLLASFCWACGSVYSKRAKQPASTLLTIGMQMMAGGLIMTLVGVAFGEVGQFDVHAVSARSLWAFAYLVVFGSLVGFTAYVWLLRVSTPARVSTYAYVNPLIAALLGSVILHEPLPGGVIVAGGLILAAVALITVKGHAK